MKTMTDLPEAITVTLDHMRAHHDNDPNSLLETWGAAYAQPGDVVFADLIGVDDEHLATWRISNPPPQDLRMPLGQRRAYTLAQDDLPPEASLMLRSAEYRPTNWYAHTSLTAHLAPGWPHDDMGMIGITLIRYRRYLKQ